MEDNPSPSDSKEGRNVDDMLNLEPILNFLHNVEDESSGKTGGSRSGLNNFHVYETKDAIFYAVKYHHILSSGLINLNFVEKDAELVFEEMDTVGHMDSRLLPQKLIDARSKLPQKTRKNIILC